MTKHETQRNFAKIIRFTSNQENFKMSRTYAALWQYVNRKCGTNASQESIRRYMDDLKQLDPTLDFHVKERASSKSSGTGLAKLSASVLELVNWSRDVSRVVNANADTLDVRTDTLRAGIATLAKAILLEGFDNAAVYDDLVRLAKYEPAGEVGECKAPVVGATAPQQVTAEA